MVVRSIPVEVYPLLAAVGMMSSFGLSIAYKKAVRAPDVSWTKHKDVPWNVTLERLENNKTARTPGH
ncbi:hypothetical protein M422DRAFT_35586 [Sphaerobolus stellatus SS14]|uniref:Uncharacterized protein n=1 Tax=Sphaerobolus stellatus (strain SS14) TaxID=990650 RepID=A0A0C9UVC4_SPHS4|nr:hypothetical protein M422DRAFT_35586 [Sphaerobolus stellatus SS14]